MRLAKKYQAFEGKLMRFKYNATTEYIGDGRLKDKEPSGEDKIIVEFIDNMDHVLLYHSKEFRKIFRNRAKRNTKTV